VAASAKSAPPPPAPAASVTVLERVKVAGLDAAVLEATDAVALDAWLKKNGYASSPELVEWYKPYIADRWKITAFKIANEGPQESSTAVRMSFSAERPFFPYREPANTKGAGPDRSLRVFLLSDARFDGTLGAGTAWAGKAVWSNPLADSDRAELLGLVKLPAIGETTRWLTEFEDLSRLRPSASELFFSKAADQSPLSRPDVVYPEQRTDWMGWVAVAFVAAVLLGLLWLTGRLLMAIYRAIRR
jgi:hypothetical protein